MALKHAEVAPAKSSARSGFLRLGVGEFDFALPTQDALTVAVSPPLTALPLVGHPVEGMAIVNGSPIAQVDVALALTRQPGTGRYVVVARHDSGPVGFRVDRISSADGSAPSQASEPFLPRLAKLMQPFAPGVEVDIAGTGVPTRVHPLQLFLVRNRGRLIGVPAASIERVDRFEKCHDIRTESGVCWKLVRMGDEVLPACPIPSRLDGELEEPTWGMIVEHKTGRVVWTAGTAVGLHAAAHERIRCVQVPNERRTLWYETEEGAFVEIVDPGDLLRDFAVVPRVRTKPSMLFRGDLHLRCGPFRGLLPLSMTGSVLETLEGILEEKATPRDLPVIHAAQFMGHRGGAVPRWGVVVNLDAGQRVVLAVDEVRAASTALTGELRPFPAMPVPVVQFFDGAVLDDTSQEWVYRFRKGGGLSWSGSAIEDAILGWLPAETMEREASATSELKRSDRLSRPEEAKTC